MMALINFTFPVLLLLKLQSPLLKDINDNTQQSIPTSIISLAEIPLLLRIITASDTVRARKVPGFTFQSQMSFVEMEVH